MSIVTEPVAEVPVMLTLVTLTMFALAVRLPSVGVPVHSSLFVSIVVQGAVPAVEVDVVDDVADVVEVVVVVLRQMTFTNIEADGGLGCGTPSTYPWASKSRVPLVWHVGPDSAPE
jgi:hypothetical protein